MTTLLILAGVTVAVTAAVLALLWVRDRLIDRTNDRFDYGLTDDDAPRDDNDWPPDRSGDADFEAWMRKKYALTPDDDYGDDDPEEFCSVCFAGMESSEHGRKCGFLS